MLAKIPTSGWGAALAVALVTFSGCVTQSPAEADSCAGGPNCVDAGESAEIAMREIVGGDRDASSAAAPPEPDAAPTQLCPGLCVPDNPLACEAEGELEVAPLEPNNSSILIPAQNPDQGAETEVSGRVALSPTDAGAQDLATAGEAETRDEAGSAALPGSESDDVADAGSAPDPDDDSDETGDNASDEPPRDDGASDDATSDDHADDGMTADDAAATDDESVASGGSESSDAGLEDSPDAATALDVVEVDAGPEAPESPAEAAGLSCQLSPSGDGLSSSCAPAGAGEAGDACSSARDCAPGLGCVGKPGAGQCLPYCCEGADSCASGTYCTQRPLRAPGLDETSELVVPVCAQSQQCDLMQQFPCPVGEECSCPSGQACTAVGVGGAKACVEPGDGVEGESCPCAAGYFCSRAQQTCLRLCQFGTETCGAGMCQAVGGFPEGWGLCVATFDSMSDDEP